MNQRENRAGVKNNIYFTWMHHQFYRSWRVNRRFAGLGSVPGIRSATGFVKATIQPKLVWSQRLTQNDPGVADKQLHHAEADMGVC
jgi:hypothetical protein